MDELDQIFWTRYGFTNNPYNTTALTLYSDAFLPISKAFVGRDHKSREFQLMTNLLSGKGGARIVVEGEIGVGKTTFVNYHRYLWEKTAKVPLFTPSGDISFSNTWSRREFLKDLLSQLTTKLYLLYGESIKTNNELYQELLYLNKIFIEENYQWQFNVGPLGGGRGKEKQISLPTIPEAKLHHYYRELVRTILELGYGGIIFHFDNMELLYQEGMGKIRTVFEEIRDLLQVPDVYYIFVGKRGFFNEAIGPSERVKSIFFNWPIFIKPLSKEEVLKAIHLRYELLSSQGLRYIPPVEDELIIYLYDLYQGKIRFIMDAIYGILVNFPTVSAESLSSERGRDLLKDLILEKIRAILTDREVDVLLDMVKREDFTNTDLANSLGLQKQNIAKYIKKLLKNGYIEFLEKEGRKLIYRVTKEIRYLRQIMDIPYSPASRPVLIIENADLSSRQNRFLSDVSLKQSVKTREYAQKFSISSPTALKDLKDLEEKGYLKKHGKRRGCFYEVIRRARKRK